MVSPDVEKVQADIVRRKKPPQLVKTYYPERIDSKRLDFKNTRKTRIKRHRK